MSVPFGLHIGEFTRPARSGGMAVLPGASRVLVTSQRAGRRSRTDLWLVSGDALDARDETTVPQKFARSSKRRSTVHSLLIAAHVIVT
jgi:hypothetical protein